MLLFSRMPECKVWIQMTFYIHKICLSKIIHALTLVMIYFTIWPGEIPLGWLIYDTSLQQKLKTPQLMWILKWQSCNQQSHYLKVKKSNNSSPNEALYIQLHCFTWGGGGGEWACTKPNQWMYNQLLQHTFQTGQIPFALTLASFICAFLNSYTNSAKLPSLFFAWF